MIEITLTDQANTLTLPVLEVPLVQNTLENATDVTTLDFNVYTDFISTKRQWTHTWSYMSQSDYDAVVAFYQRQLTLFRYPLLTIEYYGITDVPVRMYINQKDIIDNCGVISNFQVNFRETRQLG